LVNYRPEYTHPWNSKTYYTQLRLDPLAQDSADEMLTALLGPGIEVAPLKRLIQAANVSALMRNRAGMFSLERLMDFLTAPNLVATLFRNPFNVLRNSGHPAMRKHRDRYWRLRADKHLYHAPR
jgi:hypothetical protein